MLPFTIDLDDVVHRLELIIPVQILQAIETSPSRTLSIDIDVQSVFGMQKSLSHAYFDIQELHLRFRGVLAGRCWLDAVQLSILIGHDQASLQIDAHANPRTLVLDWHFIDKVHFESLRYTKGLWGSRSQSARKYQGRRKHRLERSYDRYVSKKGVPTPESHRQKASSKEFDFEKAIM
jgi:hypothetical protein